jgi:hypothetical protein
MACGRIVKNGIVSVRMTSDCMVVDAIINHGLW